MTHCLRYESISCQPRSQHLAPRTIARSTDVLTLDRRIVLIDEMALDKLYGQTRLSDATATDDNELVLSQEF